MTGETSNRASTRRRAMVIGAGPGGMAAARMLAEHGAPVDLVDENPRPGGAITRRSFSASAADRRSDRAEFGDAVAFHGGSICHGFDGDRPVVSRNGLLEEFAPVATIVAVGARERIRPLEGSLLKGVLACGAAQTLLKGSQVFPYRSAVVAGSGPLLLATASQLLDAGVRVRAIIEETSVLRNLTPGRAAALAASMSGNVMRDAAKYAINILRHGVRVLSGYRVEEILGEGSVRGVRVSGTRSPGSGVRTIDCESLVLGYGFVSSGELVQQAGAEVEFDPATRFWKPVRSGSFETSVPDLYSVGDCAGVQGKEAAQLEGALAAAEVLARFFGLRVPSSELARMRRRYARIVRFQAAMGTLYPQPPLTGVSPRATVCRCEGVTQAEIDEAIEHGARDFRSVKLWTRTGMGICQGRTCQPVLSDYLQDQLETVPPTVRFPVRPLPFIAAERLARGA